MSFQDCSEKIFFFRLHWFEFINVPWIIYWKASQILPLGTVQITVLYHLLSSYHSFILRFIIIIHCQKITFLFLFSEHNLCPQYYQTTTILVLVEVPKFYKSFKSFLKILNYRGEFQEFSIPNHSIVTVLAFLRFL